MVAEKIITEKKKTGKCKIDVEAVKESWNNDCSIFSWESYDEKLDLCRLIFELVEFDTENPEECKIKVEISMEDAIKIIKDLRLRPNKNEMFQQRIAYRRE